MGGWRYVYRYRTLPAKLGNQYRIYCGFLITFR